MLTGVRMPWRAHCVRRFPDGSLSNPRQTRSPARARAERGIGRRPAARSRLVDRCVPEAGHAVSYDGFILCRSPTVPSSSVSLTLRTASLATGIRMPAPPPPALSAIHRPHPRYPPFSSRMFATLASQRRWTRRNAPPIACSISRRETSTSNRPRAQWTKQRRSFASKAHTSLLSRMTMVVRRRATTRRLALVPQMTRGHTSGSASMGPTERRLLS